VSSVKAVRPPAAALAALLAVAIPAAGCGGGGDKTSSSGRSATEPATGTGATGASTVKPSPAEADPNRKPRVPKGEGTPPSGLVVQDLIPGHGRAAQSGDTIAVQYVGVLFDSGKEFDASWSGDRPGQPFEFPLGGGQVIPGWDRGLIGMKQGGRRKLIVPSALGYGAQGAPPDIPPNAALIFDVDLQKIVR
jgi:peptidylprolyl isomerase